MSTLTLILSLFTFYIFYSYFIPLSTRTDLVMYISQVHDSSQSNKISSIGIALLSITLSAKQIIERDNLENYSWEKF